ncbi:MAG: cytochrome c [Thiobacillus sp.]|nr:cytochrome c [Thiobacillus sp.]
MGPAPSGWWLMLTGTGFTLLAALAALAVSSLVTPAAAHASASAPSPARQQELVHMVRQECGFCHGLRLTGGLGSPLTAQAMREKPAESLEAAIRHGIPGTAMPGWEPFLTEAETRWIVQNLQQGFPE